MNKVAIVDDSDVNLTLLDALVKKLGGCEPVLFSEPHKGLTWCAENIPDLIIVDYMMPDMNGMEFISRLRTITGCEEIPVLMITASDSKGARYAALQIGATDFLERPVDRIEFSARTRNLLALNNSRKKLTRRAFWLDEEVKKATAAFHTREMELVFRMARAAEFRDRETGAHIQRIAYSSQLVACKLNLSADDQELIFLSSPMHDVGKIGIPDRIMLKPGKLTPDEFEIMKGHAQIGFELLNGSASKILQSAATIALSHHERYDGTGYPEGLCGDAIPLFGRIVAVADVFDALISERPYKKAWPMEEAAAYLRESAGKHFEPACVAAFLDSWDEVLQIHAKYSDENIF